jgi:hypothetical protein
VAYADYKDYIKGEYTVLAQGQPHVTSEVEFLPFAVYSTVIDTDPFTFDDESEVIAHLQEYQAEGDDLNGYLVQQYSAPHVVIVSLNAATWLSEHAPATVQWRKVADLPVPADSYVLEYMRRFGYQNASQSTQNAPRRDLGQKVVQLPNMQRRSAQTPITRKQTPMPRETVMQIVSRVRTPLAGQVRRIA